MSEKMKILVSGKRNLDPLSESMSDSFTIVTTIDDALEALCKLQADGLVIIFDNEPGAFYLLFARVKELSLPVQVILLYPDKRYFMMGDNEMNNAVIYHVPVKSGRFK
jgi:hypothetical protein